MKIKNIIVSLTISGVMLAGTAFAMPDTSAKTTEAAQFAELAETTEATEGAKTPRNTQAVKMDNSLEALSPKQLAQWEKMHENHIQKTRPIRSDLQAKYMELKALRGNAKVTPEYISTLTKSIVTLENRIEDLNKDFFRKSEAQFKLDFSSMMNEMHGGMNCPMMRGHGTMKDGMDCSMMRGHGAMTSGHADMMRGHAGMKSGMHSPTMKNGMDCPSMKSTHDAMMRAHGAMKSGMDAPTAMQKKDSAMDKQQEMSTTDHSNHGDSAQQSM